MAAFAASAILISPASAATQAVFVTLGTGGGPVTRLVRSEPANALVVGDSVYLFDAGDGVQRRLLQAGLPLKRLRAVFISHHHIDHTGGVAPLIVTRWVLNDEKPLPIIGPPGTVAFVRDIVAAYHVTELAPIAEGGPSAPPLANSVLPRDMPADPPRNALVYQDENIRVFATTNDHYHFAPGSAEQEASRSYAFRIEAAGRTIVFTGDTGPSANVDRLAKGADLLVSEVIDLDSIVAMLRTAGLPQSVLDARIAHMRQDHMTPRDVGRLAADAGVKELVLTHLVPGRDGETSDAAYTKGIANLYGGPVHVARDGDRF
ncbi:MAG TPA: MBL fold metallo-hydrolase [Steroidobacteraceae bacterium]|nr:MBL fold metallo-hydrolase [Steroidobacteraceae bacterium]